MKPKKGSVIYLIYDESALTIYPSFPALEKKILTYTEKTMVRMEVPPFSMTSKKVQVPVFTRIEDAARPNVIMTYQGLYMRVITFLIEQGYQYSFHDARAPFYKPQLHLMGGFRFSQEPLVCEALNREVSGLVGAPTRYGKTAIAMGILAAFPEANRVLIAPGHDLVRQLHKDTINHFSVWQDGKKVPKFKIPLLGAGSSAKYQGNEITVCSMDSMHKLDPNAVEVAVVDEPHAIVTDSREEQFARLHKARKYGLGASLDSRYDGKDILIEALIGPVLAKRTYREAVKEGAVCQITAFMIEVPFAPPVNKNLKRETVYDALLYRSDRIGAFMQWLSREMLPPEWQSLIFIKNEASAEHYLKYVGDEGTIAMAKRMSDAERKTMTDAMKADIIKRCLATIIYSTGVTFNHLRVVANLEGGGPYTGSTQKPGRVAEVRPGKKRGVIVDFSFKPVGPTAAVFGPWTNLVREAQQRMDLYRNTGYEVLRFDIDQKEAIRAAFLAMCV